MPAHFVFDQKQVFICMIQSSYIIFKVVIITVMMTFCVRLKKNRRPNQLRLRFDLEKLRDTDVACTF